MMQCLLPSGPRLAVSCSLLLLLLVVVVDPVAALTPLQPISRPSSPTVVVGGSVVSSKTAVHAIAIPLPRQKNVVKKEPPFFVDNDDKEEEETKQQQHVQQQLDPKDAWVATLDYEAFGLEVAALGKQLIQDEKKTTNGNGHGSASVAHLNKMLAWRNAAALIGVATLWTDPNPLTVVALSTWTYASWLMIGHHVCHGGYNRVVAASAGTSSSMSNYNSRGFALGSVLQRGKDWLDWILPEAWNLEHNRLHHYRLNEVADPDLVQNNAAWIRQMHHVPTWIKQFVIVPAIAASWKFVYYAPNTYKELKTREWIASGKALPQDYQPENAIGLVPLIAPGDASERAMLEVVNPSDFFVRVMAPYFLTRFVLLPAPLLAIPDIGPTIFGHALVNLLLAEALTNVHAFCTVVTNHCGHDLYTFDDAVKPRSSSFYVRQIVGSANYETTGTDVVDFAHGFLNYQIEHHVWPDLSMLQYQKAAPMLKAICEKHGVPYIQESVWERVAKTTDVMVGKANMRPFPTQYEPVKDKAGDKGLSWQSDNGSIDGDDKV